MKKEETIVTYTCDVCGEEIEKPNRDFARTGETAHRVIGKIVIDEYYNSDGYVMEDICWECNSEIFELLDNFTQGFRYANTNK